METPVRVGIVGFSRLPDGANASFADMVARAAHIIEHAVGQPVGRVHLVSGGAPWGDHVAVRLFLDHSAAELTLHLPVDWDADAMAFYDSGRARDWRTNPGQCENELHRRFSAAAGIDSLGELEQANIRGARLTSRRRGFHARNSDIAASVDWLIAFSWAAQAPPLGGTGDTWAKAARRLPPERCIHVAMNA